MAYKQIPQIDNVLNTLYNMGVTTNEQLLELTTDDLYKIRGFGDLKVKAVQQLQNMHLKDDVFRNFKKIQPRRMKSFFNSLNINYDNIFKTKLHTLYQSTKITPSRKNAFLEYKHECLRGKFNNTLPPHIVQSSQDIIHGLKKSYFKSFQSYLSNEQHDALAKEADKVILDVGLERVDLKTYGDDINLCLDYEFFFSSLNDNFLEDLLYQIIYQYRREISLFILKQKIEEIPLFNDYDLNTLLDSLLKNGFVIYTSHGMKHHTPKALTYLHNNPEQFEIINERLKGKTLEEIGKLKSLTRERIRQLEQRESKNIPLERLFEYKYISFFHHYDLSEEEFCQVFDFSPQQCLFLKLYTVSDKNEQQWSKEDLLESQMLNLKEQEELLNIINKDYLIIDNRKIKKTKFSIITYCVEQFAKDTIRVKEFHQHVLEFCDKHTLDIEFESTRAVEGLLYRVDPLLWKYGKQIRYYNVEKELIQSTVETINFNRYNNQEVSAKKIFDDYYDELTDIDIEDEYELHNLFKKHEQFLPDKVYLRRMPLIEIGKVNREEQLIDLLIEYSPISKDDFALRYTEKYGVLIQTVKTNFIPLLNEFGDGDILNADTPIVPTEVIHQLKSILIDDFYFKEDVYSTYNEKFGEERLPDYVFSLVGYRNFADFILKDDYVRADYYFENTYFNKELFDISDTRLMYLGSFRSKLNSLQENLDVFKYDKHSYIRFEKIHDSTGITKDDIVKVIEKIIDEVGDRYFTVDHVEPIIENSVLNQLGFDNIFYESILKSHELLRFQYMGNKTVFRRTKEKFYISNLVEEVVSRFKRIDIYDLITYLNDTYYFSLSREKIIQCTEVTNLYYHPVMEMVYQDIDEFYDMMEGN